MNSEMGAATAERGGQRKRIYTITAYGSRALEAARDLRLQLRRQYPAFAGGFDTTGFGLSKG
ncbi:MAG: hypothetical protein WBA12_11280 [Catalinimonas sp.]